jgi:flagellar protein FliS
MNDAARASEQYLRSAVLTASPEQLQLMMIEGAIRFATRGISAIQARDHEAVYNAMDRAQRIVLELINGMRRDANPELVDRMTALYNFIYRRLVEATVNRDVSAAEEAIRILRHERATWELLIAKVAAAAPASPVPAAASDGSTPSALCIEC